MKKVVLPKLEDAIQHSSETPEIYENAIKELQKLPNDFFYKNQLISKLSEALRSIAYEDGGRQPFIANMRDHWTNDIRTRLVKAGIRCNISIRGKSVISVLKKCNRIMAEKKSITSSLYDLIGIEIVIFTKGPKDNPESICNAYKAMNIVLEYFYNLDNHPDYTFELIESNELKEACKKTNSSEKLKSISKYISENYPNNKVSYENLYIPKKTGLDELFQNFCKDYIFCPKLNFYQSLHASLCLTSDEKEKNNERICFEVQVKTQPQNKYNRTEGSPANHSTFKAIQAEQTELNAARQSAALFNLELNPEKAYHIFGFDPEYEFDSSGIVAPRNWTCHKITHL